MALLNALSRLVAAASALVLGACSLVLDPDDLRAKRALDADTKVVDTSDASDASDTIELDTADTIELDTADATELDTADTVTDTGEPDTTIPREVIVHYSGEAPLSCTFDYKVIPITNCPSSCPDNKGWNVVVDASDSTGVGAFNWRFGATDGYSVNPTQASGPRVTLTIGLPSCELIAGAGMGPGSIAVELSTDGGAFEPRSAIRWAVRSVSASACTSQGFCPEP